MKLLMRTIGIVSLRKPEKPEHENITEKKASEAPQKKSCEDTKQWQCEAM